MSADRSLAIAKNLIDKFQLDLSGLTVIAECASDGYLYTPVMAALAGAKVIAVGRDSAYGKFEDNKARLTNILSDLQLQEQVEIFQEEIPAEKWGEADIVLNSGFVRPITKEKVAQLKSTAVIPLMWETWEFRKEDLDLTACQEAGIAVIGTDESYPIINMFGYNGYIAIRLLFELGVEVHNNELVLLGGGKTGEAIAACFDKLGLSYDWFTTKGNEKSERCYAYEDLKKLLEKDHIDAVIAAEHLDHRVLMGEQGFLTFTELQNQFPAIQWGHICGNVEVEEMKKSGIQHQPEKIMPDGYMSFQAFELGERPVIDLNVAGLKVGEIAAKARLAGDSIEESIQKTITHGIGQDFEGGFLQYKA